MRVVTIHQPFTQLIASGAKEYETRSWPFPGRLIGATFAIHAAKTTAHLPVAATEPFKSALAGADLPLGVIVATARVESCVQMDRQLIRQTDPDEVAFGHWKPGNYAWRLVDVQRLPVPLVARGAQGIWRLRAETEREITAAVAG